MTTGVEQTFLGMMVDDDMKINELVHRIGTSATSFTETTRLLIPTMVSAYIRAIGKDCRSHLVDAK